MRTLTLAWLTQRFAGSSAVRLTVTISFVLFSADSIAYSCPENQTVDRMFEEYDAAISATVIKKRFDLSFSKNSYLVQVNSSKKGQLSGRLRIWTNRPGRCGAWFMKDEEYVIFLKVRDGEYWTDINGTWIVSESTSVYTQAYRNYEDANAE